MLLEIYNEFESQYSKQSVEEILIQRSVKMTTEILYIMGLFDKFHKAEEFLIFLFVRKRRVELEEVNDDVIQGFCC